MGPLESRALCDQGIDGELGLALGLLARDRVLGGLDGDVLALVALLQVLTALAAAAALTATQQAAQAAAHATAAAAALLAAAGEQRDEVVPRLQRAHPQGQEAPVLELLGQDVWTAELQEPEAQDQEQHQDDGHPHPHQHWPAGQREAEYYQWDQEEKEDDVHDGEPAILG